jgi:hypothetical protein
MSYKIRGARSSSYVFISLECDGRATVMPYTADIWPIVRVIRSTEDGRSFELDENAVLHAISRELLDSQLRDAANCWTAVYAVLRSRFIVADDEMLESLVRATWPELANKLDFSEEQYCRKSPTSWHDLIQRQLELNEKNPARIAK